ncbi:endolytic transglycosylase MltG [Rheinheimera sp. WS51]|uniref:endolytic transglycosylase MltG n=1 Tax=Rheinheimera sp. WS51 TaxID=3425886 RepID=UPI003D8A9A2A
MLKKILFLILLIFVSLAGYFASIKHLNSLTIDFSEPIYTVKSGASVQGLCREWVKLGQLSSSDCLLLKLYTKLKPQLASLQQGSYRVSGDMPLFSLLSLFRDGKVAQFSLTFIEGQTVEQAIQRLQFAEYLKLDIQSTDQVLALINWPKEWGEKPTSVEGLLFPDTYYYTANSSASQLIQRATDALIKQLSVAWQQRDTGLPLQNPYQLLTLASIVEKESSYLPERRLVSSVFINRLRKNMRLQTDPTVIYGIKNFNGDLTRKHLRDPHPYNTYRHAGLPPGPISLVSQSALLASAQPETTDLYYFVSKGDGSHQFSTTLKQHNAAVQKYIFGN